MVIVGIFAAVFFEFETRHASAENSSVAIETAMFTHQEFFGADAIVPLPTATARDNLAKLANISPDDPQVLEKLAEANEKLGEPDAAEKILIRLAEKDPKRSEGLAAFYERRARFEDEAKVLRKMLSSADSLARPSLFGRIVDLAREHDLKDYTKLEFYREVAAQNTDVFPVFDKLIDRLEQDAEYPAALEILKQANALFPDKRSALLAREVSLLEDTGNGKEAEKIYLAAFDPFWTDDETTRFYEFLSDRDRLREYGAELKAKFEKDNADFDTAIRLASYRTYYTGEIVPIFLKLEKAKRSWSTDELITATRILLRENEGELASRFLYTLYNRPDINEKGELRARILYQLFEMFMDAQDQKLPLTRGDLSFYRRAATIDTDPGIATGILSLIFSDTDPAARLDEKEAEANKYFNRAAAYRIFLAYKDENVTSPELGQMYLDIVRLYTATGDLETAKKTLSEFAARYKQNSDLPTVALKLADAFVAANEPEKSREIYREVLDAVDDSVMSDTSDGSAGRNEGIAIPPAAVATRSDLTRVADGNFRDKLAHHEEPVTYREVLERLVSSLAREKNVGGILEVFSVEIKKHPQSEWLYEERLSWLEQTNLTDDQLAADQEALSRFQSSTWRDKVARWFLRQNRHEDFDKFSTDLVGKLNDAEIQQYLTEFIDSKASAKDFEKQLYLKLYLAAHARFPHNLTFVNGLLAFYKANKLEPEWRKLAAEYFFESSDVRKRFLDDLAEKGELRGLLSQPHSDGTVYKLFYAAAAMRLSNYEAAIGTFRELDSLYPNSPEFSEQLVELTRSFGQRDRKILAEAAEAALSQTRFSPASALMRTRSGELFAELGNYDRSREEWNKLIDTASGSRSVYLDTATVYWDYFQYDDALRVISSIRKKFADETLCSFESGAIHESQHDVPAAIREYVKALDADQDDEQRERAKRRLTTLSRRSGIMPLITSAFEAERGRRSDVEYLTLAYAEFLTDINKGDEAERLLDRAIAVSHNSEFLEDARRQYEGQNRVIGEQAAMKRLAEVTESPRRTIKYRLQLAESFSDSHRPDAARSVLVELVRKFPKNYGVVTTAAEIYRRIGKNDESVAVLKAALTRSRGEYRTQIAAKLSQNLVRLGRLNEAEQLLVKLHGEYKADLDLFRNLAEVYVRRNEPEQLRAAFNETIAALKGSKTDRREVDDEVANFRAQMIDAFTQLKDYRSAVEQHIEIINRDPDDEQLTDNAIAYAKRYGGGETLLKYYQATSTEAFKNYRWNVVLARIYDASGDAANAIRNYRAAIGNQPEMEDLYLATADIELRQGNIDGAIKDIDTVLELTNDAPIYLRRKIDILKKAGRTAEAQAVKAKLPSEESPNTKSDPFAEAAKLQGTENKDEARRLYREAFEALERDPLSGELTAAGIDGYVRSLRGELSLAEINKTLWDLRDALIKLSDESSSTKAGEARNRLSVLEGAMTESLGDILRNVGTDNELAALHADLLRRLGEISLNADTHRSLSLIQDLSHRAGFGELEEKILLKKLKEDDGTSRQVRLADVVKFYNQSGAYEKALSVLEENGSDNKRFVAVQARLAGNSEKEIDALRTIYWQPAEKPAVQTDTDVARFLEILFANHKDELRALTAKPSVYQFQLINFLLGKGDREAAHAAIENSTMPQAWKLARHSETSLALGEYGEGASCYFCEALQFDTIGGMIARTPDKQRFLVGDDWFRLTREYGEWLYRSPVKNGRPSLYLTALTEMRPRNSADQTEVGAFFLENKDMLSAAEHFRIAVEQNPGVDSLAGLGSSYYLAGKKDWASEMFARAIKDAGPKDLVNFFYALDRYGLAAEARRKLSERIVEYLATANAGGSPDFEQLIRAIAHSFNNEKQKADYFRGILTKRPTDTSLAKMLLGESLINSENSDPFFERILSVSENSGYEGANYDFKSMLQRTWSVDDAESIYDQENDYQIDQSDADDLEWRQKYIDVLFARHENVRAATVIGQVEKDLHGRSARPAWLRLARLRSGVRSGRFDEAQAERFIGINVAESVADIKPPNLERFDQVRQMLVNEKADGSIAPLSESFYGRLLALDQLDNANFVGLSRTFFSEGKVDEAVRLLRSMVDISSEETRPAALREINGLEAVRSNAPDAANTGGEISSNIASKADALTLAADVSVEFGRIDSAIVFRRELVKAFPANVPNRLKLSELLAASGDNQGTIDLLSQLIAETTASRADRWQAKWQLHKLRESVDLTGFEYDPYPLFYRGVLALGSNDIHSGNSFLIDSLIAGTANETSARLELIKSYAINGRPYAALKLAESDTSPKDDELLEVLSAAAEQIGEYAKAVEFEKLKSRSNSERIAKLEQLVKNAGRRATDLIVDRENTRKL